ncbi:MAG: putative oxidoreductase C-terminal domain-containing protein [Anaerohalosphaeraceae bacterium]
MNGRIWLALSAVWLLAGLTAGCQMKRAAAEKQPEPSVRLLVLDPGHFHAALVQKTMYEQVSPEVFVYAPGGPELDNYLGTIESFNTRTDNPTAWLQRVYQGPDYLERMLSEKKGNVVVISGKNSLKTDYIYQSVRAGLHVLADKPMVIAPDKFPLLVESFRTAEKNGVLLYDIMTERFEITTILQKELAAIPEVFGDLQRGSPEEPAAVKESVHHFFKYVAGRPLRRPAWFFDPAQRGEDLADVSTHLVDLIQWECFPEEPIDYRRDIQMLRARRWTTPMTAEQFREVTGQEDWPEYLKPYVKDNVLYVKANGQMDYTLRGIHARVCVRWEYRAPEGAGDMHYSILRGSRCNLVIRQGPQEKYKPTLYVESIQGKFSHGNLEKAVLRTLQKKYPGIGLERIDERTWKILVPDFYYVGHEAHFAQVMQNFLRYLKAGRLPDWEVPNMLAKYYTTMEAVKAADRQDN